MDEAGGSEGGSGSAPSPSQRDILTTQVLLKKGKRHAAKIIRDECLKNQSHDDSQPPRNKVLGDLLDLLLNPAMGIKNWDTIDWLKWLMAAGRTPDEFCSTGERTDGRTHT
ncbi:hypothetical protein Pcinc_042625 [Petrolisthes cinctipes]|uniref:Uncharacterized protein n=1 Tax=Petrolisthes cinctipes TaxID=88211 RepID=A0AAE1BID5_PETCI|nr:hypothetical protein Pcinc_042625 [Petrolisthes cinctipes]